MNIVIQQIQHLVALIGSVILLILPARTQPVGMSSPTSTIQQVTTIPSQTPSPTSSVILHNTKTPSITPANVNLPIITTPIVNPTSIPTSIPTLIPTSVPTTPPDTYSYDSYYPIILSFSDDKGSTIKRSGYNKYQGSQNSNQTGITLKTGDTIRWRVQASDPKGRQIFYNFHSNSTHFNDQIGLEAGRFKWSTNSEIQYSVTSDDIKSAGELMRVVVQIKSNKDNLRFPGGEYDDATYLDYKLSP